MESFWAPTIFSHSDPSPNQLRFEGNRVKQVLTAFGLADQVPHLIRDYQDRWGEPYKWLTFESFHRFFKTFPFMMDAQSFYRTSEDDTPALRLRKLFDGFGDTFIAKRYATLLVRYEALSDPNRPMLAQRVPPESRGLPLAMPFPFGGLVHGLVIHNAAQPVGEGFQFSGLLETPQDKPMRVWVEKFDLWLAGLVARGWQPSAPSPPLPTPLPLPTPPRLTVRAGAWLQPWMLRVMGGANNATYLLAWLFRISEATAGPAEVKMRHVDASGTWVRVPRQNSEQRYGMTESQFQRAIAELKRQGFVIVAQRRFNGVSGRMVRLEHVAIEKAKRAATARVGR